MGIQRSLAERKGKQFYELPKEMMNNRSKKSRRRQKKKSPVQTLFDTCKEVFAMGRTGFVPSPERVDQLRSVLDSLKPADLGITPDMPYFRPTAKGKTPIITYLHLHECDKFSIGVFCLPPSGVIPLHNHPGMTVFSKLLLGTMHIKSFDWASSSSPTADFDLTSSLTVDSPVRLAKVKVDSDFTAPCGTSILYPSSGGNMHRFTALTACVVLDVLGPPYSDPDGRHCQYYFDYPIANVSVDGGPSALEETDTEGYAWLQERGNPDDLIVDGAEYTGPEIAE